MVDNDASEAADLHGEFFSIETRAMNASLPGRSALRRHRLQTRARAHRFALIGRDAEAHPAASALWDQSTSMVSRDIVALKPMFSGRGFISGYGRAGPRQFPKSASEQCRVRRERRTWVYIG